MELVKSGTAVKKSIFQQLAIYCCLLGLLIVTGFTLFFFLHFDSIDYSKYGPMDFEDDQVELMARYDNTAKEDYLTTFTKPYELANIAVNKVSRHEYAKSVAKGVVKASISNQYTDSYYQKCRDTYFFENVSKGAKTIYYRFYQQQNEVLQYTGDANGWKKDADKTYITSEYEEAWGRDLARYSIFIISSKTTLKESTITHKDGKIYLSLELHPIYSVLRYVKQMVSTSDLTAPPTFQSMHIDMTLDEELNLLYSRTDEHYEIQFYGITIPGVKAYLDETLIYDVPEERPTLDEVCDYSPANPD